MIAELTLCLGFCFQQPAREYGTELEMIEAVYAHNELVDIRAEMSRVHLIGIDLVERYNETLARCLAGKLKHNLREDLCEPR